MPGILDILGGPIKALIGGVGDVADKFIQTGDEKAVFALEVQKLAQATEAELEASLRKELEAKERIIVAELQQDDKYTKRARPTVVYAGLIVLVVNHILLPWTAYFAGRVLPTIELPTEFWLAWGGITGTYAIGRSMEKRAAVQGKRPGALVSLITGGGK